MVRSDLRWWLALTSLALASLYLSGAQVASLHTGWGLLGATASRLWIVFPFIAFAGGVARSKANGRPGDAAVAVTIATSTLGLIAFVIGVWIAPLAEVEADRAVGLAVELRYPFGAQTPTSLVRHRIAILEEPPEAYGFSVDQPLTHPPNWLTYLIHQPFAVFAFGVLNALLGLLIGWSTTGLSPPKRGQVRWLLGLVAGLLFFLVARLGGQWVRLSPENSGVLAAWLPLVVPLLALAVAYLVWRSSNSDGLHGGAEPDV